MPGCALLGSGRGREDLFDYSRDVIVEGQVIHNASAKAERSADVCVRERDTAALGDVAKDVCVGAIERLLGRLGPAKADGAQLDGSKQLERRLFFDQLSEQTSLT